MNLTTGRMGLIAGRNGGGGAQTPVYAGYAQSTSINPVPPAHVAGDLLVAVGVRQGSTVAPTADAAWTLWGTESHGSVNLVIAVYYKIAVASGTTITWTNAGNLRAVWRFTTAAPDTLNFSQGTSSTTLNFEAQPTMAANSLVGCYVLSLNAQTDISAITPDSLTERGKKNTASACWAGDSNTTLLSAYDPANETFDTATPWMAAIFSIKGS